MHRLAAVMALGGEATDVRVDERTATADSGPVARGPPTLQTKGDARMTVIYQNWMTAGRAGATQHRGLAICSPLCEHTERRNSHAMAS